MDEQCDVCGGITDNILISTCSKCNISREHPYCMRILHMFVPDDWVCEECECNIMVSPKSGVKEDILGSSVHHNAMHPAGPSRVHDDSGWQAHSKRQKPVERGKVKFIPNEEVIRLSSGVTTGRSQRSNFSCKPGHSNYMAPLSKTVTPKSPPGHSKFMAPLSKTVTPKSPPGHLNCMAPLSQKTPFVSKTVTPKSPPGHSNFMAPLSQKTPFVSKPVTPKSSPSGIKANPSIILPGTLKSPRYGRNIKMQSISKINQRTSPILKDPKGSGKEHVWEKQQTNVLVPAIDVETSYKKEIATEKKPQTDSTMRHASPISGGNTCDVEHNHANDEERDLLNIFASVNLNHPCLPALDATWKGGFILDSATPGEFIGGFQARPPCKVHPEAYKFSQKMPPVLKANFLPRSHLWTDLFQDESPDLQDVALYFMPADNIERSREKYAWLIEQMENQDSMMRVFFDGDGVELLIFTSERLQLDSQHSVASSQIGDFLWGVFHCINEGQVDNKVSERLPSIGDQANMDDGDTVDMEIDMVGGKMVGRVDVVVPRHSEVTKNTERSSEMKTRCGLDVKAEKEEGEISSESENKKVVGPPGFCVSSPRSATGSTEEMAGTSSVVQHGH